MERACAGPSCTHASITSSTKMHRVTKNFATLMKTMGIELSEGTFICSRCYKKFSRHQDLAKKRKSVQDASPSTSGFVAGRKIIPSLSKPSDDRPTIPERYYKKSRIAAAEKSKSSTSVPSLPAPLQLLPSQRVPTPPLTPTHAFAMQSPSSTLNPHSYSSPRPTGHTSLSPYSASMTPSPQSAHGPQSSYQTPAHFPPHLFHTPSVPPVFSTFPFSNSSTSHTQSPSPLPMPPPPNTPTLPVSSSSTLAHLQQALDSNFGSATPPRTSPTTQSHGLASQSEPSALARSVNSTLPTTPSDVRQRSRVHFDADIAPPDSSLALPPVPETPSSVPRRSRFVFDPEETTAEPFPPPPPPPPPLPTTPSDVRQRARFPIDHEATADDSFSPPPSPPRSLGVRSSSSRSKMSTCSLAGHGPCGGTVQAASSHQSTLLETFCETKSISKCESGLLCEAHIAQLSIFETTKRLAFD